eukprot:CAMPEP_0198209220 /NCGR_PEP_ID=MMETSP1445-20131203/14191_1 /TAXON_ID=36898 /ORGANISM="Pyramimonas sp., Strain CCMP2087" /LENGTH=183 /DNA_ID=CAMNT_0043882921 /DNA_START=57 /DNA_END=608 /DNA_ORIENTATION=+
MLRSAVRASATALYNTIAPTLTGKSLISAHFASPAVARNMATAAAIGTVKWFNSEKGYGFITPADGSADLFVHQTSIHSEGFRSLDEGEEVEFRIIDEGGRTKAVDVTGPQGAYVRGAPRRQAGGFQRQEGGGGGRQQGGPSGGGGNRPSGCFKCGAEDHWARECPNAPADGQQGGGGGGGFQ